ncbi:hypothetical protein POM88_051658 [Heracleum sosnowskyi]|uniref:Uncharacterized protein n=1 Tax=Heracleum sosnowskyi TaxID=360622 RepID=A0AAD8GZX7_9APIA|nr:hypothetical protein POM88_051658 [Heracleum sosnowskyi]
MSASNLACFRGDPLNNLWCLPHVAGPDQCHAFYCMDKSANLPDRACIAADGNVSAVFTSLGGHLKNLHKAVNKQWWKLIQGKNHFLGPNMKAIEEGNQEFTDGESSEQGESRSEDGAGHKNDDPSDAEM